MASGPSHHGDVQTDYTLGYTSSEHDRLIRQAVRIDRYTERLFRDAGVGVGQRVLDLGSGLGDVSMLVARLVGPSGEVVGIDRDADSLAIAQRRAKAAGLQNVRFVQGDASRPQISGPFDAVVGRFILMFLPDPVSALRAATRCLTPGGLAIFQEPSWEVLLGIVRRHSLYSAALGAIHETFRRSGVRPEQGLELRRVFQEAGLASPSVHMEVPLGTNSDFISLMVGLASSVAPTARQHGVDMEALGDLQTLPERIRAEIEGTSGIASFVALVGAWASTPS